MAEMMVVTKVITTVLVKECGIQGREERDRLPPVGLERD